MNYRDDLPLLNVPYGRTGRLYCWPRAAWLSGLTSDDAELRMCARMVEQNPDLGDPAVLLRRMLVSGVRWSLPPDRSASAVAAIKARWETVQP